jgi:hypothetical protein
MALLLRRKGGESTEDADSRGGEKASEEAEAANGRRRWMNVLHP